QLRRDRRRARGETGDGAQPHPPRPRPTPYRAVAPHPGRGWPLQGRRGGTGRTERRSGRPCPDSGPRPGGPTMSASRFDPSASFQRLPCGIVEAHLSALLDDALSGAARERLSAHVLRCRHCTCALAELRLARDVLRRSGTASAGPTPGLSQRLRAIGDMPTPPPTATATATAPLDRHEPRAARGPYRSVPVGMAVVLVALATVTGIGWFSAPTREAAMADPGHRAEGAFAASVAAAPLGSAATAAVMTAPRTPLATRPTRLDATPIRPGAPVPQRELAALLAGTGPEVAHDGVWQVD